MRFILKTAFWLGLIAFFLPSGSPENPSARGIDFLQTFLGAQEVMSDLNGFCDRSPTACSAGSDIVSFVGARIGDGFTFAADAARSTLGDAMTTSESASPADAIAGGPAPYRAPGRADATQTAAIAAEKVRRAAGLPDFALSAADIADPSRVPADLRNDTSFVSVPVPAPRPRD